MSAYGYKRTFTDTGSYVRFTPRKQTLMAAVNYVRL